MPKTAKTASSEWRKAFGACKRPTRDGRTVLLCEQPSSGTFAWLDCESDTFLTVDEVRRAGI